MDGELYGDPGAQEHYCEPQTQAEDCVEMSVADIVGQETGHEPSETDITTLAEHTPSTEPNPLTGGEQPAYSTATGTDLQDAPELLAHYDVTGHFTDDTQISGLPTGMTALEHDLASGDKVIAGVDAPEIWNAVGDPTNVVDTHHADHAVVVTGVDTSKGVVYLNDSGVAKGAGEAVPISVFEQSWGTSGDAMVVTAPTGAEHVDTATPPLTAGSHGHGLEDAAGVTAAVAGATAAAWAAKRKSRAAASGQGPLKPAAS